MVLQNKYQKAPFVMSIINSLLYKGLLQNGKPCGFDCKLAAAIMAESRMMVFCMSAKLTAGG